MVAHYDLLLPDYFYFQGFMYKMYNIYRRTCNIYVVEQLVCIIGYNIFFILLDL